jgi:hypothetical protein
VEGKGNTRAVQKVLVHFEYLENRSRGPDVTSQPVRGDLIARPWTVTLPWGHRSVGSKTPLTDVVTCVSVAFINLLPFNGDFSFRKSQKSQRALGGLTELGYVMLCQKSLHESCRMGRCIVVMKLICSLGHCEWDGHTVHKLSQRRLTTDYLGPQENNCSRMSSKVSSGWLPSYIKVTRPVLEIFKMARYFPQSLRIVSALNHADVRGREGVIPGVLNLGRRIQVSGRP